MVAEDFENDAVDSDVIWVRDRRPIFLDRIRELLDLMKDSLAQPDLPHSEAKT
jgi:hypothetical protein